jgi:hypothetical protein
MKKFLAVFIGSATARAKADWDRQDESKRQEMVKAGMDAWGQWVMNNQKAIVDYGAPLGRTKRVNKDGISDCVNSDTAYVVVQADSHEAAAKLFINHPHYMIFPGDSIEVMECLPMPGA